MARTEHYIQTLNFKIKTFETNTIIICLCTIKKYKFDQIFHLKIRTMCGKSPKLALLPKII